MFAIMKAYFMEYLKLMWKENVGYQHIYFFSYLFFLFILLHLFILENTAPFISFVYFCSIHFFSLHKKERIIRDKEIERYMER